MPVEAKPLFRPDALRPHLQSFPWPANLAESKAILAKWATMLSTGRADKFKEQELLPDFLTDVFCSVLGYTRPADNAARFTISREKHVKVDGKFADAVLGNFRPGTEQFIVALEGKGPQDPLERPHAGRSMSAVDQGYRYAINLPCNWIIVTSMRQTRLYYKGADQYTYERFDTERLATDDALLKRFLFLLGSDRVVPEIGPCHLDGLLTTSEKVGKELTKEFYFRYAEMRQNAFEHLCSDNPNIGRNELLSATQKLLDRILFCAFCEDRGLLPADTILHAYEHRDPYHPRPIWDNFRGLFRSIDTGNAGLNIPAYNGGLFAHDAGLDDLTLSDAVCGYFRDLSDYDYRPASTVSAEADESVGRLVDVDILGHIFEQSITDLERMRSILEGRIEPVAREKLTTRRKKEGAFYTPAFITRYIVEQALGSVLKNRFEQLRQTHEAKAKGTARKALADPSAYVIAELKEPQKKALYGFWEQWQEQLQTIRVVDPACGSGAFLVEAFDVLHREYQLSNARLGDLWKAGSAAPGLYDPDRQILQHNLYGVDLNEEAVEICRLSLWIKTAARGKMLTSLDHTIRVGNSVVSDPTVHPRAFDWQAAFPEVFSSGGFDVVIGNPPYIRQEWLTTFKSHFESRFPEVYSGMADIYVYFYGLGLQLLKPGGRLAFISSNAFARAAYAERLRNHLVHHANLQQFIDLGDTQVFTDAKDVYPAMVLIEKPDDVEKRKTETVRTIRLRREDDATSVAELTSRCGWDVPASRLSSDGWQFEEPAIVALRIKLFDSGVQLAAFAAARSLRGIVTGCNDAFVIDDATRLQIISEGSESASIIKPYLRGQDIERWYARPSNLWIIFMRRGIDLDRYPAIEKYLNQFRERLEPRPIDWEGKDWRGRKPGPYKWYEIQDSIAYWQDFAKPKIIYCDIAKSNRFMMDTNGLFSANTTYIIPGGDYFLLGVLNSKPIWFALAGISIPFGERAGEFRYRLFSQYVERLPIPDANETDRDAVARLAESCSSLGPKRYELVTQFQRRLIQSFGQDSQGQPLGSLNNKAQAWWEQSLNELGDALKTSFKLKANPFKKPQTADEWEPYLAEKRSAVEMLTRQLAEAEAEINARVYKLFDLTPAEISLLQREVEH